MHIVSTKIHLQDDDMWKARVFHIGSRNQKKYALAAKVS